MHHTALHEWHTTHGGRMVDFAGWDMPIQYTTIVEEHNAVRNAAGLFDIAHMGRLKFTGPQAQQLLDHLLTNKLANMPVGRVKYSLMTNESGGILDDVLAYRLEADWLLVVNASNREKIVAWINTHISSFDAAMIDETLTSFMLALQGPHAVEILRRLTSTNLDDIKYYRCLTTEFLDQPVLISRTGYTGEDGFEVIIENGHALALWEKIMSIGGEHGLQPAGLGCRDTLRLEAGMPLYGHELSEQIDPLTAGLDFAVSLDSEFIGQQALIERKADGLKQQRIGLELEGKRIAREGAAILHEGKTAGTVTSGSFSPTLQKSIAMGYVDGELSPEGTRLEIDIRGKTVPATIVPLPFYRRK